MNNNSFLNDNQAIRICDVPLQSMIAHGIAHEFSAKMCLFLEPPSSLQSLFYRVMESFYRFHAVDTTPMTRCTKKQIITVFLFLIFMSRVFVTFLNIYCQHACQRVGSSAEGIESFDSFSLCHKVASVEGPDINNERKIAGSRILLNQFDSSLAVYRYQIHLWSSVAYT